MVRLSRISVPFPIGSYLDSLYYPNDLDYEAITSDWSIRNEIWFGMSLKYRARSRSSGLKAIVKAEYEPIVYAEFCWSRLARMAGLPAVPVQLYKFSSQFLRSHRLSLPFGTLIEWIQSKDCEWLWRCKSQFIEEEGIDAVQVAKLKAFALWANPVGREIGEFILSKEKIPFLVDHQDAFFPVRDSQFMIDRCMLDRYIIDNEQREQAFLFWETLPSLLNSEHWSKFYDFTSQIPMDISPFADSTGSLGDHIQKMLLYCRPSTV